MRRNAAATAAMTALFRLIRGPLLSLEGPEGAATPSRQPHEAEPLEVQQLVSERPIRGRVRQSSSDVAQRQGRRPGKHLEDFPLAVVQVVRHTVRRDVGARHESHADGPGALQELGLGMPGPDAEVDDRLRAPPPALHQPRA